MNFKEKLNEIRSPGQQTRKKAVTAAVIVFVIGVALGVFAKWLDNLELDSTVWWHGIVETLDLGNFFSDFAIWLLCALIIAVFSCSPLKAAINVFVFFVGMCVAYHLWSIFFSGFNPNSYMMIWYGITLVSPILAVLCWYAKGKGAIAVILDICIFAVFTLSCFAVGWFYVDSMGILYLLVFIAAAVVLYRNPKQLAISLVIGFLLAFPLYQFWPYR